MLLTIICNPYCDINNPIEFEGISMLNVTDYDPQYEYYRLQEIDTFDYDCK